MSNNLSKRHRSEKRFIAYGFISLILAATMLATIIGSMIYRSIPAYTNYSIDLEINMTEISAEDEFEDINFRGIIRSSLFSFFPEVESRSDKRKLFKLISSSASYTLRDFIIENPSYINKKFYFNVLFTDDSDLFYKGYVDTSLSESERRLDDQEVTWLNELKSTGRVKNKISKNLFLNGDSREPEVAGFLGCHNWFVNYNNCHFIVKFSYRSFNRYLLRKFCCKKSHNRFY